MTPTTLTTDRLTLRPPAQADAERVTALVGDLRVTQWLTNVPHPYDTDMAREWIARVVEKGETTRLICGAGGTPIGCVSLRAELGYWLGLESWGHGYATEAAHAVLSEHFAASDQTVGSGYILGNERSAHVLRKLGFEATDIRQDTLASTGKTVSVQKMSLTAERWRAAA